MTYKIKIDQFEGPFDLLLFFIERDELDIHDIPIAKITNDFLEYIRQMEALNIDLASEFIVVAATLMRIKARLLLPRKVVDEEGNEIDPREELVRRLVEYRRYKEVIDDFRSLEEGRAQKIDRGNAAIELKQLSQKALIDTELESLTLFKLMKAFERVMERSKDQERKTFHKVYNYNYTVEDQEVLILDVLKSQKRAAFEVLFDKMEDRLHAIITFLALLALINTQQVNFEDREGTNNFVVSYKEPVAEEASA
ncbi:MAG: segregation/condensation protein A [Bacteroidia bacterium]|nr:segregation/condensation protein A [Bacteroidia bacterium]